MKTRFQKTILLPGAVLYLLTAAYMPLYSSSAALTVTDKPASQSPDGTVNPQSDPFPVCPQCTPSGTN